MSFTLGILLIAVTVGMVLIARPVAGEPVPFLKVWFVGQLYLLGAMVSALSGVTVMINSWPF
jgi:hypothetical protein